MKEGSSLAIDKVKMQEILEEQIELMTLKNEDYSSNNIAVEGSRGVAVRLVDKVARLRNLLSQPKGEQNFESIRDTFQDISNYGIIGQLLEMDGWGRDFESVFILGLRNEMDETKIRVIEHTLRKAGITFSWSSDIWRYTSRGTPYALQRGVIERLIEVSDGVIVAQTLTPGISRIVEWAVNRGYRVIIVGDDPAFIDCEQFDNLVDAMNYIVSSGLVDDVDGV